MNPLEMLGRLGYEAANVGNDMTPCTISRNGEPVGFLMPDFTLRLLPEHEAERPRLNRGVDFSLQSQGLNVMEPGEYVLSKYRNVLFTMGFDYETAKPIYHIFSEDAQSRHAMLDSFEDRGKAAAEFAARSGLVQGEIPSLKRQEGRLARFTDRLKTMGYHLAEPKQDEPERAYDILDARGGVIGFIGTNNRVTMTTGDNHVKKHIIDAYLETDPNRIRLPSFFETLKERLKEIGLALKVIFTGKGQHYAIHDKHREIATVSADEQHTVTYTPAADAIQRAKIDAMVESIKREQEQARAAPQQAPVQEPVKPVPETNRQQNQVRPAPQPVKTPVRESAPKFVYICSPYRGDMEGNRQKAVEYCRYAYSQGVVPLAPHTIFTQYLDDTIPEQRAAGLQMGLALMGKCEEMWVCGDVLSEGMQQEINAAAARGIVIRKVPEQAISQERGEPAREDKSEPVPVSRETHDMTREQAVQQPVGKEFYQSYDLLQTMIGFDSPQEAALAADMTAQFGTADEKEFLQKLEAGAYQEPKELTGRIRNAGREAEHQNTARRQPAAEKEKERA